MAEDYRDKVDRRGYVTIQNGDVESQVVPSAVHVWVDRGWSVVDPPKQATSQPEPTQTDTSKEG